MYLAITMQYTKEELEKLRRKKVDGQTVGYHAFTERLTEYENVWAVLNIYKRSEGSGMGTISHANVFQTKKRACEVVEAWNESYRQNGTYAF